MVAALDHIPKFHDVAWAGPIANGFQYLSTVMLPQSDVLILSDVNHSRSQTLISDMFSAERLQVYSDQGVTDIYIERVEPVQQHIDALTNQEIDKATFIERVGASSFSCYATDEARQLTSKDAHGRLADAVIAASQMSSPIKFHAAQMSNTDEQSEQLRVLQQQVLSTHRKALDRIDAFFDEANEANILLRSGRGGPYGVSDIDAVFALGKRFIIDDCDLLRGGYKEKAAFNAEATLKNHFKDRVPDEMLMRLGQDLNTLNLDQLNDYIGKIKMVGKFRIDNDEILARHVMDTRSQDGRVIVVHGAAHGAARHDDLDEHLQNAGFAVNRVNIYYDSTDINLIRNTDQSDIHYSLEDNKVSFIDHNGNSIVDGGVYEDSPVVANGVLPVVDESLPALTKLNQ